MDLLIRDRASSSAGLSWGRVFPTLLASVVCSVGLASPTPVPTQPLDDPIELLSPIIARSEVDDDRMNAAALFSAGRMLEQRRQFPEALKRYQRALRYAPDARPILREMLPLAFSLNRRDIALRHLAANLADSDVKDPLLLRAAAQYLSSKGDWAEAIELYERIEKSLGQQRSPTATIVQLELGRLYFLEGRIAASSAAFENVLAALREPDKYRITADAKSALVGEDGDIFELMGAVFLENKAAEQAKFAFSQLNDLHPDEGRSLFNQARVELAADRPEKALELLEKNFEAKSSSQNVARYELLASILEALDKRDELLVRLSNLRERFPDDSALAYYYAEQLRKADRTSEAIESLRAATREKPLAEAYQSLFEIHHQNADADALLDLIAEVAEKTGSLSAISDALSNLTSDEALTASVIKAAKQAAADATEENAGVLRAAALLSSSAKRWDDAEDFTAKAIQADEKAAAGLTMALGLDLFIAEQFERAEKVFKRGIELDVLPKNNPALHFYLAGVLAMQDKNDEALEFAEHAAKVQPKNPMFVTRPAWVLYHAKRYEDAEAAYKEFVEEFDEDYSSQGVRESVADAKLVLSHLCTLRNDIPQAVEYIEQVLDEFPDDPGANNDLGYLWADENQHLHRAHRMIRLAVAAEPDNAAYRDSLGWVLFRLERYAEALVELQIAIETQTSAGEPPDATVLEHLADVYERLGRAADAQATWAKAVEAFKRDGDEAGQKRVEAKLQATEKPPPAR